MTWMFTESDAVLLSLGQVTVTVTGTVSVCIGAVQSVCRSAGLASVPVGALQRYVTAHPIESCADAVGGTPQVTQAIVTPLNVIESCDGIDPVSSPVTRMKLRDGNPMPVPQWNAPRGAS